MTLTDRLRALDPARHLDTTPPDDLLALLLAEPRPTPPSSRRIRRPAVHGALALGAAAALAAGISVARGGDGVPDLAARAYAQTDPAGVVLHVVRRGSTDFIGTSDRPFDGTGSSESWSYGKEVHTVLTERQDGEVFTYDQLLGTDDVVRNLIDGKEERVTRDPQFAAAMRKDPVADFRARYERGVLDDTGTATFRGRPARRYVVTTAPGNDPGMRGVEEYFIDAETGAPLGLTDTSTLFEPKLKKGKVVPGKPTGTVTSTQVIERIERLPATPGNLAKVRSR